MKVVSFSLEQGSQYFAQIDGGGKFFVGKRVPFGTRKGLVNLVGTAAQRYDRAQYRAEFGFWADFIHPMATAEGGLYHALNTYDRARFTFTFLQFAAHVPDGDFVRFFRTLLQLPAAAEYFPDLRLQGGRIVRIGGAAPGPLETSGSTTALMDYLNPSSSHVEDTEIIQAAKFVHWAQNDPDHRRAQVEVGVALFRAKMVEYAQRYALDGVGDELCLLVSDIRHQGRAKSVEIVAALQSADPREALLAVGEPTYHGRLVTLRTELDRLRAEGRLGKHAYDASAREFVPK